MSGDGTTERACYFAQFDFFPGSWQIAGDDCRRSKHVLSASGEDVYVTASHLVESGTIVATLSRKTCVVKLSDGRQVEAVLDLKSIRRNNGCLFGDPVGWAVNVRIMQAPKLSRVVSLQPQST